MSFVNVAPQLVSTAAADAARIGSAINTANTAAAATTQVLAAAQDEVSTAIAALFGSHGQHYQAISAQVAAYQQRFVLALSQAGSTYAVAEAASATPLQNVLDAINAPVQSLTGRPLIGDGANGIDGTGQAGGNGGWLWGNGGNGGSGAPGRRQRRVGGTRTGRRRRRGGRVDRQRWARAGTAGGAGRGPVGGIGGAGGVGGAGGAAGAVTTITHASFNDPHGGGGQPGRQRLRHQFRQRHGVGDQPRHQHRHRLPHHHRQRSKRGGGQPRHRPGLRDQLRQQHGVGDRPDHQHRHRLPHHRRHRSDRGGGQPRHRRGLCHQLRRRHGVGNQLTPARPVCSARTRPTGPSTASAGFGCSRATFCAWAQPWWAFLFGMSFRAQMSAATIENARCRRPFPITSQGGAVS
ncbi:PE-PGRS family protein [Mycobacterium tuberculosis RGTB327]|nr:PE-PGRS family protein [Mycobacterium tuberculosis RGTB327]